MVACLNKKKYSALEVFRPVYQGKNEVGVQFNNQMTPKILNIEHKKTEPVKVYSKQLESSLLGNWSQDVRDGQNGNQLGDHWKCRKRKVSKKGASRDIKSIEAR
jgi:hypothetical protein